MAHCLAKKRDGSSCSFTAYDVRKRVAGQQPRSIFCKIHDEEYRSLLKQYSAARLQCRQFRWLFDLSIDRFASESDRWLRFAEREAEPALFALNKTSEIRAIRQQRFAAAFDEFANDESISSMKSMAAKCRYMLRICAAQLEKERLARTGFWEVLADVFCCCCNSTSTHGHRPSIKHNSSVLSDQAQAYYQDRNPGRQLTRDVELLAPSPVVGNDKDPVRAANTARKQTLLRKLRAFMSSDRAVISQLGISVVAEIKGAVLRRIIYDDKVMLRKCRDSILGTEAFLNSIMTTDDLELLWSQVLDLTPATLRDALVDLESQKRNSQSTTLLGRRVVLKPLECTLTLRGWETLYILLGGDLTYGDVYFLSSSAAEFLHVSAHITTNHQIFGKLLSSDVTENDPLFYSLKVLGFVPVTIARGYMHGVMRDAAATRQFVRASLARSEICLRADFPDGLVLRNDDGHFAPRTDENEGRRRRRTGRRFSDGCDIQVGPRPGQESTTIATEEPPWALLQTLAEVVTGRKEVTTALDSLNL